MQIIQANQGWPSLGLKELWRYRELLWFLSLRDIKVRYKQTVLGAGWAIIRPLLTMLVFNLLFSLIGRKPVGEGIPYAVTTYCALLPWQLFSSSVAQSGGSLVANANLVKKVYFPRLLAPASPVICALIDFFVAFLVLLVIMAGYSVLGPYDLTPTWRILTLPLFLLLAVLTSLAAGLWLSALNALYRDVRYIIPFIISIGQFISPVVYETQAVIPARWQAIYGLNPMAGVIEGFRWALLGRGEPPGLLLLVSSLMVVCLLVGGVFFFRRMEHTIVDLV